MGITKKLFINLIISFWLILIAVFSIQNIDKVSLKFFMFESISIPIGVLLSIIVATGFILGSLLPVLFTNKNTNNKRKNLNRSNSQRTEFSRDLQEENDPLFDWE
ncbi:lipopolysaccharide assembly protein LapA domain-containing protein [Cyanobacterium sp. DS4]|uniref:lipopolysaccharide assembly protein LapA domain-containing protein n=1 Tax=Cyanobacterium sp. DS4 TaxID=2878255 RepID=UPI002E80BF71|nr:lipopolysaccharide assembly protein LapA domain-containing protein [Cyanobacterium sp. Dongsha4]WVL01286.1 lipopolysaccharide assembly protein LapA domain-containing protein [Cyanobacterium sp. Dongsha4]